MGTSISQPSERNTNWSPVHAGYKNKFIPEERIVKEIWRASENDLIPISQSLKSDAIYDCYEAIKSSKNATQAVKKYTNSIAVKKHNSIMAELAKRAIYRSFTKDKAVDAWISAFLSEVTIYIISRDISGFVGSKYRIKSIKGIISFKNSIAAKVENFVLKNVRNVGTRTDWNLFVDYIITRFKSNNSSI